MTAIPVRGSVFITGATSGFGRACARRFAEDGFPLVLAGRRRDRLDQLAGELGDRVPVHLLPLDVRSGEDVAAAVRNLPPAVAAIDILVNNAGLALGLEPAHRAVLEDWDVMIDTNVRGVVHVTRAVLPGMVERDRGHVILMGSIAATWPYPGGNVYGATKAFVAQFGLNLRADLLGTHVRVTVIEPGLAETEFASVRFKGDDRRAAAVYAGTQPLAAEDVAEAVRWVAALPEHVNVNRLEMMPTVQAWGPPAVHRGTIPTRGAD